MEQMPNDVLENLMQAIYNEANKHELFRFNDWISCCNSSFYDAVKECLISSGMFNPQTDQLTISSATINIIKLIKISYIYTTILLTNVSSCFNVSDFTKKLLSFDVTLRRLKFPSSDRYISALS